MGVLMDLPGLKRGLLWAAVGSTVLVGAPAIAQSDLQQELEQLRQVVEQSAEALAAATARIEELERQQAEDREAVAAVEQRSGSIRAGQAKAGVEAQVYGQVNQAFLYADNKQTSRFDVVDNDNSGSRFGFRGKYTNGDWTSGVRLEVNFEVNTTDELTFSTDGGNGTNAGDEDFLSLRWANLFFSNKNYGTLNLGFGEIATQGISESDLSGTTLIAQSDVDDIGGELQFGNSAAPELGTGFEVDDFFSNLDGFRDSAISYHSPRIEGFQFKVAGRVDDDEGGTTGAAFRPDVSVNYENSFGGYDMEAAVGFRREEEANVFIGSVSALAPFGTSLTLGGGFQDNMEIGNSLDPLAEDPNENFAYVKLGQKLDLFEIGTTAFSADFFRGSSADQFNPATGGQSLAVSFGGGVVQKVKPLGAEVYAAARYYSVETGNGVDTDGILTFFTGARVKF